MSFFSTVGVYGSSMQSSPQPVALADLDNDAHMDISVAILQLGDLRYE